MFNTDLSLTKEQIFTPFFNAGFIHKTQITEENLQPFKSF